VKLGLFVNDVATEDPRYTTTRLALTAARRGHQVWYIGTDGFAYDPDESLRARARRAPEDLEDLEAFLGAIQSEHIERIAVSDLDVLLLRSDPAKDFMERPWAQAVGLTFGELAADRGVTVLNDPAGLCRAVNKLYFQAFPASVRPETLVTRDPEDVRDFVTAHDGRAVIKPVQGSGGQSVFLVSPEDEPNLGQMIEAVARDGYVVVQEQLEAAAQGDLRLFVMDGRPLEVDGRYAAFRRVPAPGEIRSNMTIGGKSVPAEVDDTALGIVEAVGPTLVEDGMFLAGLDIVGDKLMEVNVFSPGGLGSAQEFTGVDFAAVVVDALEAKVSRSGAPVGGRPGPG
jgi:glutathione synthase